MNVRNYICNTYIEVIEKVGSGLGLKCRGKSWFVFIVRPSEDFYSPQMNLKWPLE